MIDASHHPFEENVKTTKEVVEYAHAKGVLLKQNLVQLAAKKMALSAVLCMQIHKNVKHLVEANRQLTV